MSTTIDDKVVEMRFDNQQFETNVSKSLSSIDKLKQSLDFSGASKGFEDLASSAKNCDFSSMGNSVDSVKLKFSALETVAVTALANITTQAIQAGEKILSALTIDPISSGFEEYETQINAIQTILANTESAGTTLNDVNSALDELNTYADKTIYNFTEMTKNIGTFTAAGIDLETSVSAIQGIANLAAVSGSTSQQASTAMYQLSQALAAGTVKLMDWNSVVNAGMGGEIFKNALIETSELLGTGAEAYIEAEGSFRESLSEGWLTAEVLTQTLAKFTTSGAVEYVAEYTGLSKDLVEAEIENAEAVYGESAAFEEAAKVLAEKSGTNAEEIADVLQMAQTAEEAATKVKTFTQLFDTLKEAAQSGWTQTWEILIGDFDEAKELLTEISDAIGGLIQESADARNNFLTGGLMSGWKQLLEEGISDTDGFKEAIIETVRETDEAIADSLELTDDWEESLREGWLTSDILSESISKLADEVRDLGSEELDALGYTRDQADALLELEENVKNGTVSLDEFIEKMERLSGRENVIDALRNACSALYDVFLPIKEAFSETFLTMTSEELWELTDRIRTLSQSLVVSDELAENLKDTFSGLFSVLHIVWQAVLAVTEGFAQLIAYMSPAIDYISEITAELGRFVSKLDYAFKVSQLFAAAVQVVVDVLKLVIDIVGAAGLALAQLFGQFMSSTGWPVLQKIFAIIAVEGENALEVFAKFMQSTGFPAIESAIVSLANTSKPALQVFSEALGEAGEAVEKLIEDILGIEDLSFNSLFEVFKDFAISIGSIFGDLGATIIEGISGIEISPIIDSILQRLKVFASEVLKLKDAFSIGELIGGSFEGISNAFSTFVTTMSDAASNLWDIVSDFTSFVLIILSLITKIKMTQAVSSLADSVSKIAEAASKIIIKVGYSVADVVDAVSDAIKSISKAIAKYSKKILKQVANVLKSFSKLLKAEAFKATAEGVYEIAKSVLLIAAAMVLLGQLDQNQLNNSIVIVGILGVGIGALVASMSKINSAVGGISSAAVIISLATSLLIVVAALNKISNLDTSNILSSLGILGVLGSGLSAFAIVISKNVTKLAGGSIFMLSFAASLNIMANALLMLNDFDTTNLVSKMLVLVEAIGGLALVMVACKGVGLGSSLALLSVSVALLSIIGVMELLSTVNLEGITSNIDVIVAAFGTLIGLVLLTKIGGTGSASTGLGVLGLAASLLIIIQVLEQLGDIDQNGLSNSVVALGLVSIILAGMVAVSALAKHALAAGTMLIMAATALSILSIAITLLSVLDASGLANATAAITTIGIMLTALIAVTSIAKRATSTIVSLTVAVGVIALAVALFSQLDGSNLKNATDCMTELVAAFALLVASTSVMKKGLSTLIVMALVVAELGAIIGLLATFTDTDKALTVSEALSLLLVSLAGSMALINTFGKLAITSMASVGIMTAVTAALALIIGLLANLTDVNDALIASEAISLLLISMSASLLLFSIAGSLALVAATGIGSLITVLLAFEGIAIALGGIVTMFPVINDFVDTGIDLFCRLAEGLGEIISSFIGGISSGLPDIATDLSDFMTNLEPFLIGIGNIDSTTLESIVTLFSAMNSLPKEGGLLQLLTGETNVSGFAENAQALGEGLTAFANSISGIDSSDVEAASSVATALVTLLNDLPKEGGFWQMLTGSIDLGGFVSNDDDVTGFAENAKELGEGLANFASSISGISSSDVEAASTVAAALTDMLNDLPKEDGFWQKLAGGVDLDNFGANIKSIGEGLASFSESVSGIDTASASSAVAVGQALADLMNSLDNTGGAISFFTGDNTLKQFGSTLESFGEGIAAYSKSVSDVDTDNISAVSEKLEDLIDALAEIEEAGISASTTYGFTAALKTLASNGISGFTQTFSSNKSSAKTAVEEWVQAAVSAITAKATSVSTAVTSLCTAAVEALTNSTMSEKFKMAGEDAADAMTSGIMAAISECETNIVSACNALGLHIAEGIAEGITSGTYLVISAMTSLSSDAEDSLKFYWDINSPSDRTKEDGEYIAGGLAEGIESGTISVVDALIAMSEESHESFRDWWGIHSNSDTAEEDGEYISGGLADGITNASSLVTSALSSLTSSASEILDSGVSNITSSISDLGTSAKTFWNTLTQSDGVVGEVTSTIDSFVTSLTGATSVTGDATDVTEEATDALEDAADAVSSTTEAASELNETAEDAVTSWSDVIDITSYASDVVDDFQERFSYLLEGMEDHAEQFDAARSAIEYLALSIYQTSLETDDATESLLEDAETVEDAVSTMYEAIKDAYLEVSDTLLDTIESQMDLFSEFDKSTEVTSDELISNLQSQIDGVTEWANMMQTLAERGISEGILKELMDLGPEGYEYVAAFVSMTASQLEEYNTLYAQYLAIPEAAHLQIMSSYALAGLYAAQGFAEGIDETAGVDAATELGESTLDALETALEENSPSEATRRMGVYLGEGLLLGITDAATDSEIIETAASLGETVLAAVEDNVDEEQFQDLGKQLVESFNDGLTEGIESISETNTFVVFITDSVEALSESSETLNTAGQEMALYFLEGIEEYISLWFEELPSSFEELFYQEIVSIGELVIEWFSEGLETGKLELDTVIATWITELFSSFSETYYETFTLFGAQLLDWVMEGMMIEDEEVFTPYLIAFIDECLLLISERYEEIQNEGAMMLTYFLTGIKSVKVTLIAGLTAILTQMISVIRSYYSACYQAGYYLMEGFAAGISDGTALAVAAAESAASQVSSALSSSLEEESPSKLTYEMGLFFIEGLANGIKENARLAADAASSAGKMAAGAMQQAMLDVSYWIEYEMDTDFEPTIRPVMDLDQLRIDALKMAALLSISDPVATRGSGLISSSMNDLLMRRMNLEEESIHKFDKLSEAVGNNYNFTQNNYSPKSLSRIDIYRQTKSQFSAFERMAQG